jgi:DNA-directed RNA polymerase alpha subunit
MNPRFPKTGAPYTDEDVYYFTLENINVSLANALRRTILTDIPTVVFYTEVYKDNKCIIKKNTCRLHNEILKHRLSCIPIHSKDQDAKDLVEKYVMECNVKNETDTMRIVTTEDFRIKNKETGAYLKEETVRAIFPPNPITNQYIDFMRLRPKIGESIEGEEIQLSCEFAMYTAKSNAMFNVVSKCAYGNTIDEAARSAAIDVLKSKWHEENMSGDEIEFQVRNFHLLDGERYFIKDSFDYCVQTVGVYENDEIVRKAAMILYNKFADFIAAIDANEVLISTSPTTMAFAFDITLENEDYTMGKVIEYILYEKYYMEEKTLSYCGFKKLHPHDTNSIVRIAYEQKTDKNGARENLRAASVIAAEIFKKLMEMF